MVPIFLIGNTVFISIGGNDRLIEQKYYKASINGEIFPSNIYTIKEILTQWPEAKTCKDFLELADIWRKK